MGKFFIFLIILLFSLNLYSLTVDDIIKMSKTKKESVILGAITNNKEIITISDQDVAKMEKAKISKKIINTLKTKYAESIKKTQTQNIQEQQVQSNQVQENQNQSSQNQKENEFIMLMILSFAGLIPFIFIWIWSIKKAMKIGAKKGIKFLAFGAGLMWGPLGIVVVKYGRKKCPYCLNLMDNNARICLYCRKEYDESMWDNN